MGGRISGYQLTYVDRSTRKHIRSRGCGPSSATERILLEVILDKCITTVRHWQYTIILIEHPHVGGLQDEVVRRKVRREIAASSLSVVRNQGTLLSEIDVGQIRDRISLDQVEFASRHVAFGPNGVL
jgi:hypothetical protein